MLVLYPGTEVAELVHIHYDQVDTLQKALEAAILNLNEPVQSGGLSKPQYLGVSRWPLQHSLEQYAFSRLANSPGRQDSHFWQCAE